MCMKYSKVQVFSKFTKSFIHSFLFSNKIFLYDKEISDEDKVTEESDETNKKIQQNERKSERRLPPCKKCPPSVKKATADKGCLTEKKMPLITNSEDKVIEESDRKKETACNTCSPLRKRTTSEKIGCQCSSAWTEKLKQDYKLREKNTSCSESRKRITAQS